MNHHSLTIITINLNNSFGLAKTIESVVKQSNKDFEFIIIDGSSTDGSIEVINKNADKISYWVTEPDKGIYNAMNKGIRKANGDYLLFLNSGDFLYDEYVLENVKNKLNNEDIVYGNIAFLPNDFYRNNSKPETEYAFRPYPGRERPLKLYLRLGSTLPHQAEFIHRRVFEKIGLYNEAYRIASDFDFNIRCLKDGSITFRYIPDVISYFVLDGIGSDFSGNSLADNEVNDILEKYFNMHLNFAYRALGHLDKQKARIENILKKV